MVQKVFVIKVLPEPEWMLQFNLSVQTNTLASPGKAMPFFKTNSLAHASPKIELRHYEISTCSSEAFKSISHSEMLAMPAHNGTIPGRALPSRWLSLFRQSTGRTKQLASTDIHK